MSVYNGEQFLREAIDSILRQTFTQFEFLVVNDGSTDGSLAIIKSYTDPRIRLVENDSNIGLTRSLNRGLSLARGEFIARMDCDDISLPERLEKQVRFLDGHPEHGVVGCGFQIIDAEGRPQYAIEFSSEHNFLRWYLCFQNPIVHPAALIRRELLTRVDGYNPKFVYAQDYELWWRASWISHFSVLPEQLFRLRRHKGSLTHRHLPEQMKLAGQVRQEMVPRLLGRTDSAPGNSLDDRGLNRPANANLILDLYHRIAETELSAEEREMIRRDAAARLAILTFRWPLDPRTWPALISALKLDWLVILRILGWPVSRYLFKKVRNPILFCA